MNGDNINDLILVTNDREKSVHVRFGISTGQLGPQLRFLIEKPHALQVHNVDGLAGEEILTVDAVSGRLTFYKFAAHKEEEDADWPMLFYPLTAGKEHTKRDLAVSDFDGDGLADIAISEPGQTAELGLAEPMRFPALSDITSLSAADPDNDGRAELGVLSVKEKILGLSKFEDERLSFPKPIDVVGEPLAMELADVDGDGGIDCVYVSKDANNVRTLRAASYVPGKVANAVRGGSGGWDETGPALKLTKLASNPDGLKVLDVDQDGLEDILIFVKYELPILVRQTQKGTFEVVDSPRAQASLIKEASLSSIGIADVDKQKGKELLLAQKNFARSLIFADGERWSIIDQYNAKSTENEISAVAAFDMGLEKMQDRPAILLLDGQKGQLQILRAGEDKTYRFEKQLDVGKWNAATHLKMLFAALTGADAKSILLFDSQKFVLITPPSSDNVPHYLEQRFTYETKIKDGAYGNLEAGDINSDERADIVMVEYKRNHIEILTLDSQNKPVPAMRFKIFEEKSYRQRTPRQGKFSVEPRELEIADVTGDGKDDLVTVIHDRIIVYPQD
ncbi:MAG: FG-GAP repeat domain-containing protein [Planctomycetota bacterium]